MRAWRRAGRHVPGDRDRQPHVPFAVGSLETPAFCCLAALAERSTTG